MDDMSTTGYAGPMAPPRWLDQEQSRAWLGYRLMRRTLDAALNRELARDTGLSEPDYDVLSNVSAMEGNRCRMSDLGARMLWSKSRLSHHITRMEQRGLVRREEVAGDGRGAFVVLTGAGVRSIERAAPLHVESVRRHFIDLLSEAEIRMLADITDKVLEHLRSAE